MANLTPPKQWHNTSVNASAGTLSFRNMNKLWNSNMKAISCALFVVALLPLGILAQNKTVKISDLDWFAGCWEINIPERQMTISEMWTKPSGGTLIGVGRTVVNNKTVSYEYLRIVEGNEGIDYIAKPSSNSGETPFRLKNSTAKEVVFENLANDFPQRVIYRREKAGSISARIEGSVDGKAKPIDFPFLRVKCN